MSYQINRVTLLGTVSAIYEKTYPSGFCLRFCLSTQRMAFSKAEGKKIPVTDRHYISLWRQKGLVCKKYIREGDYVYVEGELGYRKDTNDEKKLWTEVVVDDECGVIMYLGPGLKPEHLQEKIKHETPLEDIKPYATNVKPSNPFKGKQVYTEKQVLNEKPKIVDEDDIPF